MTKKRWAVTIDPEIVSTIDGPTLRQWMSAHDIDVAWVTLDQTIEFWMGGITYTRYSHFNDKLIFRDNEPALVRETHRCTIACRLGADLVLERYEVREVK